MPNTYNNQYPYNSNQLPNSNTYGGQMGSSGNQVPNSNIYTGQIGANSNQLPNSNPYGGSMGSSSGQWSNTNTYNRYNSNAGNNGYPNRDNTNNNNNYGYSNQNPFYYNSSSQLARSLAIFCLSLVAHLLLQCWSDQEWVRSRITDK